MKPNEDQLVCRKLVKAHLIAAMTSMVVSLVGGGLYSLQFLQKYPFVHELLSPGRIRMIHTNVVAYGFIVNGLIAGMLWAIPRLTGKPILSEKLGWVVFWAWQLVLVATFVGLLFGYAQAIEWGETPIFVDPLVVVGFLLLVINLMAPIIRSGEKNYYVSLWYFMAAFIWTALTYLMGNYLPQFFVPGVAGAAITGLFIHDLVGLLITPIGWGLMYYLVPVLLKKPSWSHALGLTGFWGLAFFYPLNGVHHFLWSPIPMYAQYGAVVSTIAVEIVVATVILNFFATLRGNASALRTNLPIRWFFTGMIGYAITCLQCAVQTTLSAQEIIHFTDWVVGHAHLVMFGVFGFWILGFITEVWPRLVGKPWTRPILNGWTYWLSTLGLLLMFIDLLAAGLVQGTLWKSLAPWEESVTASVPFWWTRAIAGTIITIGQLILVGHMWTTARSSAPIAISPSSESMA
jgi:cytochrome c oxidase cbb3-type subunit 1